MRGSLLGAPLFWKIVAANVAMVAGVCIAMGAAGGGSLEGLQAPSFGLMALFVGVAGLVNGALVWTALSPLRDLHHTLEDVRHGDLKARVRSNPLADSYLREVRETTNSMLDALARSQEATREVSLRLIQSEEMEQEKVSGALYGGSAQTLAGILVRLQMILRSAEDDEDREALEDLRVEVLAALEEVRAMARRLHPPELGELGVRAALAAHVRHLVDTHGIPVQTTGDFDESRVSDEARTALFRVVREAITNAALHAHATGVTLRYSPTPIGLEVLVEDDGVGFDVDAARARQPQPRGLLVICERAGYAQGWTQLDSEPGEGTRIRLFLPWHVPVGSDPPRLATAHGAALGDRKAVLS